mmetsp:Transcript_18444/g.29560  ORF Transcript_18444/g.29560 Transcript_18444/m.29560 type:complete len:382 (-) Transcript_18444:38-1183(-)
MEGARALLDSLMGQTRDVPLKEAKKKKGHNFKENNICKFHLIGFCPQYEDLFKNTKKGHLQLGECEKIHSDAMKTEFEEHPEKSDYERTYSRDLLRYLEALTRKADDAIARQTSKLEEKSQELFGEVAKREIQIVKDQASAYLAEAEELAQSGDIAGCKQKRELYEETLKRAQDYEAKAQKGLNLDFCQVCGLRLEVADEVHGVQVYDHNQGRVHLGFVKVRHWIATLKKRIEELEEEKKKRKDEGPRKEDSGGGDRGGDASKQGTRERDRDTSNRDNYRRDDRAADRGADRGAERDYSDRDSNRRERGRDRDYGDRDSYRREGRNESKREAYDSRNESKRDGYGEPPRDDRNYDRRGSRVERGYDDGYNRRRSRSGMRRR